MENVRFDNENYGDFVKRTNSAISKMTALQTLMSGKEPSSEEVTLIKEFKIVNDYLESPLGDKSETMMKKAFAIAIIIANDKGKLPFPVTSPEQIAATVDEGLTRMKTAYLIATGEIDTDQAIEILVDRAAARATAFADRAIEIGVPLLADTLCKVMSKHPATASLIPLVKVAEKYVTPMAKTAVQKGIKATAERTKSFLKNTVKEGKKVVEKIISWLKA